MKSLLRAFGPTLTTFFVSAVLIWAVVLIVAPQLTMLERALTAPKRALDSSVAASLARDARTCISVLKTYEAADAAEAAAADTGAGTGGLAVPSASGMAVPSPSGMAVPSPSTMAVPSPSTMAVPSPSTMAVPSPSTMAVPSPSTMAVPSPSTMAVPSPSGMAVPSPSGMAVPSAGAMAVPEASPAARPYILQCDRADTHRAMVRPRGQETVYLDELHGLPALRVVATDTTLRQQQTAAEIAELAEALAADLRAAEARGPGLTARNFGALTQAVLIPMTPETRALEDARPIKQLYSLIGLRFVENGEVHERIGLIILFRTLGFAVMATALALVLCYPIAYKVALATRPERAVWLFLGLVIPYAIVELMRVYAWTTIIDNQGLLNDLLIWLGAVSEPIQFKRSAVTIFVVIVYTYVLFMVFPIYNVMSTLDKNQIEAAEDLGASALRVHWRVIIPHAKPGIAVGCIATFMLAAGAFSVPRIISRGLQAEWFSQTIYNKFFESENSNIGAAYSFAYTLVCFVLVALFMWIMRTRLKDFARVHA